jgi:hypothetical protein
MSIGKAPTITYMAPTKPKRPKVLPGMDDLQIALRDWIDREHGGNQTAAGKALGISQSLMSRILNEGRGVGAHTLRALARVLPHEVARVVGLPLLSDGEPHALPNLERAIELVTGNVSEEAISYARTMAQAWPADRPIAEWMAEIAAYDEAQKRQGGS